MTALTPIPEAWIEKLFSKMLLEYGKKFTDQWGMVATDDMIRHWANELAGYTGPEMAKGVAALSTKTFPPTLPEFKTMCRPPVDATRAYYEAVAGVQARITGEMGEWSHPAIYWAAMPMSTDLQQLGYSQVRPRWEAAFAAQMARTEWEPIPAPVLALTAPGKASTPPEVAQEKIKRLVRTVMAKPADFDHKAWAHRIIEREDAGETIASFQLKEARAALAIRD